MTTYTYHFRTAPDISQLPEGYVHLWANRVGRWNHNYHREVMGGVVYPRPLSQEELERCDLMSDPRNHLAGRMMG